MPEKHKQFEHRQTASGTTGDDQPVLVYATFPSAGEAERVGGALVDCGLAACVNIMPGMTSIYVWQGERRRDAEVVMIAKTRAALADRLVEEARRLHPYTNPALLVIPVLGGSADFCRWIAGQTAAAG